MGQFYEPKKYERADLERYRPFLFNLSLVVTLLLTILAFEWKSYDRRDVKILAQENTTFEEIIDVPPTEIPPPPPQVVQQPHFIEVPDQEVIEEIKIEFDIEVNDQTVAKEFVVTEAPKVQLEEEETDKIFLVVEQTAEPKGGIKAFYKYVSDNIRYPSQARRMNIEGKVFVEFVVEKDGTLSMVTVIKGIGAGCDEEAVRIIENSPPWNPGKQRGKPVKQRMVLPIHFVLANRSS